VLAIEGDAATSLRHQRAALGEGANAVRTQAPLGAGRNPPRLLLLTSEEQLFAAQRRADETFELTTLVVERFDPPSKLPHHHAIWNTISDADRNAAALRRALAILSGRSAPVINHPGAVLATARAHLWRVLGDLEGVVTPKVAAFPQDALRSRDAAEMLAAQGFGWPLLLRAPGYHSGQHFVKVDAPDALAEAASALPASELLAIEYAETRCPDRNFRKFRVLVVDGTLYPVHVAISRDWKVHYFSADMAERAEHRAEDAAFLEGFETVVGPAAAEALRAIAARLKLDYGGIDFALDARGRVVVFEANATMTLPAPPRGAAWDYRRTPVKRILDATRRMLLKRARAGGWLPMRRPFHATAPQNRARMPYTAIAVPTA
jgi:glutathione synthase/RimK-type ligase-like ATP-grasp enzyme